MKLRKNQMKLRRNQKISPKNLAISYLGICKFLGRKSELSVRGTSTPRNYALISSL